MRVLNLSAGQDTGGQQGRTAAAFRAHAPDWHYDSVTAVSTFYPIDHRWNALEIRRELWPAADVVHVHNSLGVARRFAPRAGVKPLVVHYHGTAYRTAPERRLIEQRHAGALGIVSTIDLWAIAPDETEWLPAPYDLAAIRAYREPHGDPDVLRVAHAPTNRAVKGTEALIRAVDRLQAEGRRVELDVIEREPWDECLRRKGRADVYVDQALLGYGCNAVEAWAMGLPVIAGVDPARASRAIHQTVPADTRERMVETFGGLPFFEATEDTLYQALSELSDPFVRRMWAEIGAEHVEEFHAAARVVRRLQGIYRRAAGV